MCLQFVSNFLVKSLDTLAYIANPTDPQMMATDLMQICCHFLAENIEVDIVQAKLTQVKLCYGSGKRENISTWNDNILAKINNVFCKSYMKSGQPAEYLFFPNSNENDNNFTIYCDAVDHILNTYKSKVPPYACQYFNYFYYEN